MKINRFERSFRVHDFNDKTRTCGERIRASRIKKDLSIQELANILNRDYSFVVKYETDKRIPKDDLLIEIGNALGVSPLYLKYGQYYDEIDDYGGIAIHYYSNVKCSKNEPDLQKELYEEIIENINILGNVKNNDLNYLKIINDISKNLVDHKNENSKENKKLVDKIMKSYVK